MSLGRDMEGMPLVSVGDAFSNSQYARGGSLTGRESEMLILDKRFVELLRRMIAKVSSNPVLQQDLMQEAMLHAWRVESENPTHTTSWYIQSCRFHLQHWLARGRSIDSPKRANMESPEADNEARELPERVADTTAFDWVSFRDLVQVLSKHLRESELPVLHGLLEGMHVREICRSARISYPTVLKYRNRIASLVHSLQREPAGIRLTRSRSVTPVRTETAARTAAPARIVAPIRAATPARSATLARRPARSLRLPAAHSSKNIRHQLPRSLPNSPVLVGAILNNTRPVARVAA